MEENNNQSIMKSPLFNKRHLMQYLLFGGLSAAGYLVCAIIFMTTNRFENAWWLYVGNAMFMLFIFLYARKLTTRKEDKLSAMTMLMAGHSATVLGIIMAALSSMIALLIIQPGIFTNAPAHPLIDAPAQARPDRGGSDMALMILINVTVVNFCIGSFISLISSYAIKKNQTKDKPAPLHA